MDNRRKKVWDIEVAVLYFPGTRMEFRGKNFIVEYSEGRPITRLDAFTNYGLKLKGVKHNNWFFKHFVLEVRRHG